MGVKPVAAVYRPDAKLVIGFKLATTSKPCRICVEVGNAVWKVVNPNEFWGHSGVKSFVD